MATNRKIPHTKNGAKRRPSNGIERAAKRAGIDATTPEDDRLSDEDRAIIADLDALGLRSTTYRPLVARLRTEGHENDTIRRRLLHEAHTLEGVAKRLRPEPTTRDDMLTDALEVLSAVEDCFYVNGSDNSDPAILMKEALASAEQEFDMFSALKESTSSDLHWQELWRAGYRVKLARKLAEFREKHGVYKPTKKDDEQATEVSS